MKRRSGTVEYHNVYQGAAGIQHVSNVGWPTRGKADDCAGFNAGRMGSVRRVAVLKVTYK